MEKAQQMMELVSQWRSSGLTRQQFCDQHGDLSFSKLCHWIWQSNKSEKLAGFIELKSEQIITNNVRINYPNGVSVDVCASDLTMINHLIKIY